MGVGGKLIAAFVMLIIGVVLISTLSTQTIASTALVGSGTESFSVAPARVVQDGYNINDTKVFASKNVIAHPAADSAVRNGETSCAISSIVMKNASGAVMTANTDYVWNTDGGGNGPGNLTLKNTGALNTTVLNTTTISYSYCGENYMTSSWGRTAMDITIGLLAIALFLGAVGFFYSVAKDVEII